MERKLIKEIDRIFSDFVLDEHRRIRVQYNFTYSILAIISMLMTIVNIKTGKTVLMFSTLAFSLLCVLNIVLMRMGKRGVQVSTTLFQVEFLILLTFFIVSGTPEGFSAIWCAMLPTCGMILFQRKRGTILSAVMLAIIIFFFWTPLGKSCLQYRYTDSFMLRFPMLYTAFYFLALFLETIRKKTADNYHYQSLHDPLTKIFNRRGFQNQINSEVDASDIDIIGFMIFDIDHFKHINDTYGHFAGDSILVQCANRIQSLTGLPLCRWGGEEFAVFDSKGLVDEAFANKVCSDLANSDFMIDGKKIPLTLSIGAVRVKLTETSLQESARLADKCLYQAKESGRNKAVFKDLTVK